MSKTDQCEYPTACAAPIQPALRDSVPARSPFPQFNSADAKIIDRNYKIADAKREELLRICDLCGGWQSIRGLNCLDNGLQLCARCDKQYRTIPARLLRHCLERFLMGNVV